MYCLSYFKVGLTYFEVEVIQRKLCVPLRLCVSALKRRLRRQTARRRLQVSGAGYGEVFDFAPPDDAVVREDWRRFEAARPRQRIFCLKKLKIMLPKK